MNSPVKRSSSFWVLVVIAAVFFLPLLACSFASAVGAGSYLLITRIRRSETVAQPADTQTTRQQSGEQNEVQEQDNDSESEESAAPAAKVQVCHKPGGKQGGRTLSVSQDALKAHLKHGDTAGACPTPHK